MAGATLESGLKVWADSFSSVEQGSEGLTSSSTSVRLPLRDSGNLCATRGEVPLSGTPVCGVLFGRLTPMSPSVIVPLETRYLAMSFPGPVLTRDRGSSHRPIGVFSKEILATRQVAVSIETTRNAMQRILAPSNVSFSTPRTLRR